MKYHITITKNGETVIDEDTNCILGAVLVKEGEDLGSYALKMCNASLMNIGSCCAVVESVLQDMYARRPEIALYKEAETYLGKEKQACTEK